MEHTVRTIGFFISLTTRYNSLSCFFSVTKSPAEMAATLAYTPVNVFIPVSTCVAFDACLFETDEDLAVLSNERV